MSHFGHRVGPGCRVVGNPQQAVNAKPGSVGKEVPYGDLQGGNRILHPKARDVRRNRRVQVELALVSEHDSAKAGKGFRLGLNGEQGSAFHRQAGGQAADSIAFRQNDLAVLDDRDGNARRLRALERLKNKLVEPNKLRRWACRLREGRLCG